MKLTHLTIDPVLREFFDANLEGATDEERARLESCETSLRNCLDFQSGAILTPEKSDLLRREWKIQPQGAVARVGNSDDLIYALARHLSTHELPTDRGDLRTQLTVYRDLVDWVTSRRLVDEEGMICYLLDVTRDLRELLLSFEYDGDIMRYQAEGTQDD
jgi:hypothetical protein